MTRRSLLASLMALSLLCGGLGVAEASVHVDETGVRYEVLTKQEVTDELDKKVSKEVAELTYAKASDVATNTRDIATNQGNIRELNGKLTNLTTVVDGKVDKADTLAGYSIKDAYTKGDVDDKLNKKADAANVYTKENTFTKDQVNKKLEAYAKSADVYTTTAADAKFATSDALITAKTELDGKIDANTKEITDLRTKTKGLSDDGKSFTGMNSVETGALKVTGQISNGTVTTTLADINQSMEQTKKNTTDIVALKNTTTEQQTTIDSLKEATTRISYDKANDTTSINGMKVGQRVDMGGKDLTRVGAINGTKIGTKVDGTYIRQDSSIWGNLKTVDTQVTTNADAIAQETKDRKAAIGELAVEGKYIKKDKNVSDNLVELDKQAKTNADNIQTNADNIKNNKDEIARVNGELVKTNDYFNSELSKTNDYFNSELSKTNDYFNTELGKTNTALQATNKRTAGIGRTDTGVEAGNQTVIESKVYFNQNGNVSGVKDLNTDTIHATGKITSEGLDAGSGEITTKGKVSAGDVSTGTLETTGDATIGGDLTVNGKLNVGEIYMEHHKQESTGEEYDSATSITADGISNNAKVTDRNGVTTESKFTHDKEGSTTYAKKGNAADWKESTSNVTADGVENVAKDSKDNNNTFTQTSTDTKNILKDKDGNTSTTRQDSKGIYGYAKDKDGNKSYTKQEGNRIAESVIGQDGKQTKSEMTSTDITNTAKDGTIKNDAKDIVNKATGDMTNTVGGKLTTTVGGNEIHEVKGTKTETVEGKVTENFKNGQETNVTGNQDIHVTGKQTNTVEGGQENIISGGQTNTITGDQTTTITGNKTETVTENVTEDYKKNLTTIVGGNETHEVKGTKTETVEGKLTENFKGGQETNVSGTQTINATYINRNASSGMIDTVDNAYGTNKETKVAGSTTTEVSIKGTRESGTYIRGATEARDYIIKGTLSNSETKTAEATSTEITDGTNKASTIQKVTDLAGSVTNGKETGVSGIHANKDGSVSIDSAVTDVTDRNKYSVINQKKGSIQSTVVDGTSSTVILQDKDNVTIASSNGTVGIVGKDIVNNAQDTITNTAGTSITNQVKDSKVTTDANGTTFENKTAAVSDGGTTTTKINGNHINTGRVDANELGVSDKDEHGNTADLSVKAGKDGGVKASATDKDGNTTYTKVTATENSFQVQDKDGKNKNHQVNTKDSSENTITNGDKTNTVTSTADGTTFNNSKANTAFEGGTYTDTTIKGNTITTGKVTMDYADVMKDLGVRGNANITGKTTTGSLEVTGTSTLKGDVTMGSNATVKGNFNVEGNTNLKNTKVDGTLNVTQKATFGDSVSIAKDLSVDGNATIKGDVTANSYKVGGKTYIDANGIHANGQKITDVADGSISEGSKDAVNGGQLYDVKRDMEHKVDKVGANAAAMANLRPMEFDPSSKWNIAAAIGNYGSETAAALGAFYRPNDDVMVNLSTAFGTGENMVGGGVSVRLGKGGNKLSREENNALKDQVNDLTARMDALLSVLNPNMSKDFPDVPENHWAYEAVSRLAGNDIVQGYPDGEFHGERTMTRYEMAEIIYNALSRGAEAEKELVEEFKPELQAMAASEKATAEKAEG